MSDVTFSLPGSGYEVITKILHTYALCGDGKIALDTVASKSAMDKTLVSRNSAFLVSIGVLSKGREKSLSPQGKALAVALGNGIVDDIRKGWRDVLTKCSATSSIVDMVKIQKTVPKDDLQGRMASSLGLVASGLNKTGLNTLSELFVKAELLELVEGSYRVRVDTTAEAVPNASQVSAVAQQPIGSAVTPTELPSIQKTTLPSIHIDLEIHVSPESTPEQIDKVFESIAKHLYGKSDSK